MRRFIRWMRQQDKIEELEDRLARALELVEAAHREGGQGRIWQESIACEERYLLGRPRPTSLRHEASVNPMLGLLAASARHKPLSS